MKHLMLSLTLLFALTPAWAVICKQVDAKGVVSYSDLPPDECPKPVQLPEYSRYAPRPIAAPPAPPRPAANGNRTGGAYQSLAIRQPEQGASVHDPAGRLDIALAVQPALQEGDSIRILLDGAEVLTTGGTSGITLGNVARGRHSLQAVIAAPDGRQILASPVVTFYMHRLTEAEREAADKREAARLTEEQRRLKERLEQEKEALRERTRRDIEAQRRRVEQQRQSDFTPDPTSPQFAPGGNGTSPAYTPIPKARDRSEERFTRDARDLEATRRDSSRRHPGEAADFDAPEPSRTPSGEAGDFNRGNAPGAAPLPSHPGGHPAYTPNFTPPSR